MEPLSPRPGRVADGWMDECEMCCMVWCETGRGGVLRRARGRGGRNVLSPLVVDMIAREELAFTTAKVCSLFTPPLHAV